MRREVEESHHHKGEKHKPNPEEQRKKGVGPMYTPQQRTGDEAEDDQEEYGADKGPPYYDPDKPLDEG
ncbi:MAG: hypothetical protein M1319_03805 [Chloroflexi bacterium]|nr:hypothetical protein [Chloroflexota bacterium]